MFELPFGYMGMNASIDLILFYGFGNLPDSQKISFGNTMWVQKDIRTHRIIR